MSDARAVRERVGDPCAALALAVLLEAKGSIAGRAWIGHGGPAVRFWCATGGVPWGALVRALAAEEAAA